MSTTSVYSGYKHYKLKSECRRREIPVSGTPQSLIARLEKYDAEHSASSTPTPPDFQARTENPNDYLKLKEYQLQEYCNERGLGINGIKWQMIERLLAYDRNLWENANTEVYASANDPDFTKRRRRNNARRLITWTQAKTRELARHEYHRIGTLSITTEMEAIRQTANDDYRKADDELNKQQETERLMRQGSIGFDTSAGPGINGESVPDPATSQATKAPPKPLSAGGIQHGERDAIDVDDGNRNSNEPNGRKSHNSESIFDEKIGGSFDDEGEDLFDEEGEGFFAADHSRASASVAETDSRLALKPRVAKGLERNMAPAAKREGPDITSGDNHQRSTRSPPVTNTAAVNPPGNQNNAVTIGQEIEEAKMRAKKNVQEPPFKSYEKAPIRPNAFSSTNADLRKRMQDHNHLFIRSKSAGLKPMDDIDSLWERTWFTSPVAIYADLAGYYVVYQNTRQGFLDMDEAMSICFNTKWKKFGTHHIEMVTAAN